MDSMTHMTNAMTQDWGGHTVTKQTSRGGAGSGDQGRDTGEDLEKELCHNMLFHHI